MSVGLIRRILVTSRGVQDYNIHEYSYTAFRYGIPLIFMRRMFFSILDYLGEVLRLIRRISGSLCGASGVKTSKIFFIDQSFIYGAWDESLRHMLQSQAMDFIFV